MSKKSLIVKNHDHIAAFFPYVRMISPSTRWST